MILERYLLELTQWLLIVVLLILMHRVTHSSASLVPNSVAYFNIFLRNSTDVFFIRITGETETSQPADDHFTLFSFADWSIARGL